MADITLIDDAGGLARTARWLAAQDWFALDTEFIREQTYWPRLCLVQVATADGVACIDPLAVDDLGPLVEVLLDRRVTKVLHAAGQDLEIFHHLSGEVPAPVFDTQVAAPLLGYPEQAGFARLVGDVLGVILEKGHARTDWSERPLPPAALAYAADDVRYLVPLYRELRERLAARGRLAWLEPEWARLTDPQRYRPDAADAWRRLKGVDRLGDAARAVVQALAEWREREARRRDVPRGRVARDDALVDIARARPGSRAQLERLRAVPAALVARHGDRILELVAAGAARPAPPGRARAGGGEPPAARTEALIDALSAAVRLRAAAASLNPATLASRGDLARLAAGEPVAEVLAGWRAAVVGADLEDLIAGRAALAVTEDGIRLRADEG